MNTEKFHQALNEFRNGANFFVRHPLCRNVAYSDGVVELAEAGCYWLIDILATELPTVFKKSEDISSQCIVKVRVAKNHATLTGEFEDNVVAWSRAIEFTDLPDGTFNLLMADEGEGTTPYRIILMTEN